MKRLIFVIALIFAFVAFSYNLPANNNYNILNGFIINGTYFVFNHFFYFLLLFAAVCLILVRIISFEKHTPRHKRYIYVILQSFLAFIVGVFFSFVILILFAVLEFNFLAYFIDLNPHILGIETDIQKIESSLKSNGQVPNIIASDNDSFKQLIAVSQATTGTESFYGKLILPSIPRFLVIPTGKFGSTILIDNTLIFSAINPADLEKISPTVAYLLIKSYFPQRPIRYFPKFNILTQKQFASFREKDFAKRIGNVKDEISLAKSNEASLSASIANDKSKVSSNKELIDNTYTERDKDYTKCVSSGRYVGGIFVLDNTKASCQYIITNSEETVKNASDSIDSLNSEIKQNQDLLEAYKAYENLFNTQIQIAGSLKQDIPSEYGYFDPPDSIKIVLISSNPHSIGDYFETVVHEYYHYASYIKDKGFKSTFFDEGLTEYFARQTIKQTLGLDTNLGYPTYIKIVDQMVKDIPETDLADIYFAKDEQGLEKTLDKVYGDNFYKENGLVFELLTVTPDPNQVIKLANTIMEKIGGNSVTKEDLLSNQTSL